MSYHKQTAAFLGILGQNMPTLSTEEMQYWVEKPTELQIILAGLRRSGEKSTNQVEPISEREWKVWKWVELGMPNLHIAKDFRDDFNAHDPKLNIREYANSVLGHADFTVAQSPLKLPLALVTVAQLGFTKWTRYDTICARADKLGLDLCPAEVGPQLRRQYLDQPLGEWIVVAMKAIPVSDRGLGLFDVERDGLGLWLHTYDGRPGGEFVPSNRLVFVPRKYQKMPLAT